MPNKSSFIAAIIVWSFGFSLLYGCTPTSPRQKPKSMNTTEPINDEIDEKVGMQSSVTPIPTPIPEAIADILSVQVSGSENDYRFAVEISSPDTGCEQFADWWEVISEEGMLIYRRILLHSHRDEQPFVRSGGPIKISNTAVVFIRAHMHPTGYGGTILKGSIQNGFVLTDFASDFALQLETEPPLPDGCAF